jgi:hypothetical protein
MSTSLPQLSPLAAAISQAEGFGASANNIPTASNNPGNLELGDVGYGTATTSNGGGVTVYGSLADGANALENQVSNILSGNSSLYNPDMTIQQLGDTYVNGPNGGTTTGSQNWASNVANSLGVSPSTTVGSAVNGASTSSGTGILGTLQSLASSATNATTFGLSRTLVLILGVILFGAGLFSFRQTQTVIQTATGVAKKAGEVAAL